MELRRREVFTSGQAFRAQFRLLHGGGCCDDATSVRAIRRYIGNVSRIDRAPDPGFRLAMTLP